MLSGESENILVGDVCSGKSLDSCGEDKRVSVLRGLSREIHESTDCWVRSMKQKHLLSP